MVVLKCYYHIMAIIKKIFYKMIYGKHINFGKNVTFRKGFSLVIEDGAFVKIGDGCFFNNYCSINAKKNIDIGNDVLFGENVKIYDHDHIFSHNKKIKKQGFNTGAVQIGSNCWICSNVIVLKNAKIGDNSVIAASSVVNGVVPTNMLLYQKKEDVLRVIEQKEL